MTQETNLYSFDKSMRITALTREIIKVVPRFPNNRASLLSLQQKPLPDLLITFLSWRLRYVATRPRRVIGYESLANDSRADGLTQNILLFLQLVESGGDLTPYLSIEPRTRGYTPAAEAKGDPNQSWADKDLLLNVMGLHHFHLGLTTEEAGHVARTDELLFAYVDRENFEIIGLFDHSAFKQSPSGEMTSERERLWSVYQDRESRQSQPGGYSVGGFGGLGLSTSGHPTAVVHTALDHVRVLRELDPKVDDPVFVRELFGVGSKAHRSNLRWGYRNLDLCLVDEKASHLIMFRKGPN